MGKEVATSVKQESELLSLILRKEDASSSSMRGRISGWRGAGGMSALTVSQVP